MKSTSEFNAKYRRDDRYTIIISEVQIIQKHFRNLERSVNERNPKKLKPITFGRAAQALKELNLNLWQWDISASGRLLFTWVARELVLLDYSHTHEVLNNLESLEKSHLKSRVERAGAAPESLVSLPEGFSVEDLSNSHDAGVARLPRSSEVDEEWFTFLDQHQARKLLEIFEDIKGGGYRTHFLVGPAGSGKTTILLRLARLLYDETRVEPELVLLQGVKDQLIKSNIFVPGLKRNGRSQKSAILLDDPLEFDDFVYADREKANVLAVPLVVAIDPIQWAKRNNLQEFKAFLDRGASIKVHELKEVYRQGETVGRKALTVLTNYLRAMPRHVDPYQDQRAKEAIRPLEAISTDNVHFAVPGGSYNLVQVLDQAQLEREIARVLLRCRLTQSLRNWPKLLIGVPYRQKLPEAIPEMLDVFTLMWRHHFSGVVGEFNSHTRQFSDDTLIRGTEYENVLVLIPEEHWETIVNGSRVPTENTWNQIANPLTFLTRAESNCTILVLKGRLGEESAWVARHPDLRPNTRERMHQMFKAMESKAD